MSSSSFIAERDCAAGEDDSGCKLPSLYTSKSESDELDCLLPAMLEAVVEMSLGRDDSVATSRPSRWPMRYFHSSTQLPGSVIFQDLSS